MKVVVGFLRTKDERERERAGFQRWMFEWKKIRGEEGWRWGGWRKGSGSETIFGCVAFSLSRLFRDEYNNARQRLFRRRFLGKRKHFPAFFRLSLYILPFLHPLPFLSFPFGSRLSISEIENATKTRLQSVNITSSGSCLVLFPTLGVSCRFRRRTERFRELMRSKLVSGQLWTLVTQVHIFLDIFLSRNNEENIGDREKWLFFSLICRNQTRARAWDERFGRYSKAAGLSNSTWWTRTFLACVDFFLLQRLAINPFKFLYAA